MPVNPDRKAYVEPSSTRSIREWNPGLIKAARRMADFGHLELAADFCEAALGDDRVQAALSTRTKGFVALPLTFEAARGTKRLVKALEVGEDWWHSFSATALAQLLGWGILLGVGLGELVWTERSSVERLIPVLKVWHPRHLRYDWQRRVWMLKVEGGLDVEVVPGDGKWILYTPYGESRPWAFGAWRAISLWYQLKLYAIEDWGYYSSKNAGGHNVVEASADSKTIQKEQRKQLADEVFSAAANSAIVLPPGFTLKKVESTADTWETFQAQKNAADMGMAIALVGQNLSTEVSGPVATGATLHGRVLQVFIDADAETLAPCLHDQALVWWAEFNFGARDDAPWPVWATKPPEDQKQRADVGKTQSETAKNLAQLGVATVNEVREAAGLEPLKEGGDEIVKPAPPPAPAEDENGDEEDSSDPAKGFVRLRSGRVVRKAAGLVQGQLYADRVADNARDRAAKLLDADFLLVLEAVEAGESFDDIRQRLNDTYRGMSPDDLAKLAEAAITMAELGGRHAINEDL